MEFKATINKYIYPLIGIAAFYLVVYILGNNTRCFYRNTIGIPCPGCGLSRAYTALFKGEIIRAFIYHPLFILPLVVAAVIIFKSSGVFSKLYRSRMFWNTICILLIGLWIVRMLLYFPTREPMAFYKDAFIPRVVRLIFN